MTKPTTRLPELVALHVYPVHGEPGLDLTECVIEPVGLAGDRRKKAAVQVVAAQDVGPDTRANLVVSMSSADLAATVGGVLRVGAVELGVTSTPRGCPGVYADVTAPGVVRVGDPVETPAAAHPEDRQLG